MNQDELRKFVENEIGIGTITLLRHYQKWGLASRTFMAKEHDKMLQELRENKGHFASYPSEQKTFVESMIYVETLQRICLMIEDFCKIALGLSRQPLSQFPNVMAKDISPKSILKSFNNDVWLKLLRYADLKDLHLDCDESKFLEIVRAKNLNILNNFIDLLRTFIDTYWLVYIKHKHGNTLIYSFDAIFEGEHSIIIPAIYNSDDPSKVTGIMITPTMYQKWKALHDTLHLLTMDIVDRSIEYAETGGHLVAERILYYYLTEGERQKLKQIIERCDKGQQRVNINVAVNLEIPEKLIDKHKELIKKFDLGAYSDHPAKEA